MTFCIPHSLSEERVGEVEEKKRVGVKYRRPNEVISKSNLFNFRVDVFQICSLMSYKNLFEFAGINFTFKAASSVLIF